MRKKILKAELASSNELRVQGHIENAELRKRNMDLAKELGTFKKIEKNRKLAKTIAAVLGDGWFEITDATISSGYGESPELSVQLIGDADTLGRLVELIGDWRE